jgi:hypothetical protein
LNVGLDGKKTMEEEIQDERDAVMWQEYFHPIERFPERMNQLLEAINRVSIFGLMKFVCHSFVLALYESISRIITNAKNERLMIFRNLMSLVIFILFRNKIILKVAWAVRNDTSESIRRNHFMRTSMLELIIIKQSFDDFLININDVSFIARWTSW